MTVAGQAATGPEDALALRSRLAARGIEAPRAEAVVVDLAGDPPLCESAAALAVSSDGPSAIVACAGAAMLACGAHEVVVAVRDASLAAAIEAAGRAVEAARLRVAVLPEVWPIAGVDRELGCDFAWVLDGEALWRVGEAAGLRVPTRRFVTVAGAVRSPGAIAVPRGASDGAAPTVMALVEAAGGATAEPWVALAGGPWPGRPVDPEGPAPSSLVLVLPADHPAVLRARVSIADQLRRAASACEGCRACTEVCPPFLDGIALEPHAIVAALATGSDPAPGTIAAATACIACGVCTSSCPGALDPAALVLAARARLPVGTRAPPRGAPHPDRAGRRLSAPLLRLRAGL